MRVAFSITAAAVSARYTSVCDVSVLCTDCNATQWKRYATAAEEPSNTFLRFPAPLKSFTCMRKSTRVRHAFRSSSDRLNIQSGFSNRHLKTKYSAKPGSIRIEPGIPAVRTTNLCQGESPSAIGPSLAPPTPTCHSDWSACLT